jgi:hypothetical protein
MLKIKSLMALTSTLPFFGIKRTGKSFLLDSSNFIEDFLMFRRIQPYVFPISISNSTGYSYKRRMSWLSSVLRQRFRDIPAPMASNMYSAGLTFGGHVAP